MNKQEAIDAILKCVPEAGPKDNAEMETSIHVLGDAEIEAGALSIIECLQKQEHVANLEVAINQIDTPEWSNDTIQIMARFKN